MACAVCAGAVCGVRTGLCAVRTVQEVRVPCVRLCAPTSAHATWAGLHPYGNHPHSTVARVSTVSCARIENIIHKLYAVEGVEYRSRDYF